MEPYKSRNINTKNNMNIITIATLKLFVNNKILWLQTRKTAKCTSFPDNRYSLYNGNELQIRASIEWTILNKHYFGNTRGFHN